MATNWLRPPATGNRPGPRALGGCLGELSVADGPLIRAQWWLATPRTGLDDVTGWFSTAEWQRLARLRRPDDRLAQTLAHLVAKSLIADAPATSANAVPGIRHDDAGRPISPTGDCISLSHSRRSVAAAVAAAGRGAVGIDVEDNARASELSAVKAILCHPAENWAQRPAELLRLWVAKEALVKTGAITLDRMRQVCLPGLAGPGGTLGESWEYRPAGPDTPAWWTCEWDQCRILAWRDRDCTGALATRRQRP